MNDYTNELFSNELYELHALLNSTENALTYISGQRDTELHKAIRKVIEVLRFNPEAIKAIDPSPHSHFFLTLLNP